MLNNKTINLMLEDNTNFGILITLFNTEEEFTAHPVTGEPLKVTDIDTPLDLDYFTFSGKISKSLEEGSPPLVSFTFEVINAATGALSIYLSEAEVKSLVPLADTKRDIYNPRLRFLGYYDINMTSTETNNIDRLMQGKVFISDGVTD